MTDRFPLEAFERCFVHGGRIQAMPPGRSYHAGALRMGEDRTTAVTDLEGRMLAVHNVCVADASPFPCVGVANPMLTITALALHVASAVRRRLCGPDREVSLETQR